MNPIPAEPRRRNWDPVVKLTHWCIVTAVIANALFTREGGNAHVWVGYGLAALLALRLLWGLIGPAEARFSAFPPNPRRALAHVGEIAAGKHRAHPSHNPLGALMVYAIWSVLAGVIATGIAMAGLPDTGRRQPPDQTALERNHDEAGDENGESAGSREGDHEGQEAGEEGPLAELHEAAVNLLYLLIALHLAGVIFETRRSGREIVLAMMPGRG